MNTIQSKTLMTASVFEHPDGKYRCISHNLWRVDRDSHKEIPLLAEGETKVEASKALATAIYNYGISGMMQVTDTTGAITIIQVGDGPTVLEI